MSTDTPDSRTTVHMNETTTSSSPPRLPYLDHIGWPRSSRAPDSWAWFVLHARWEHGHTTLRVRTQNEESYVNEVGESIGYYMRDSEDDEHPIYVTGYMYDSLDTICWHLSRCRPNQCSLGKAGTCARSE